MLLTVLCSHMPGCTGLYYLNEQTGFEYPRKQDFSPARGMAGNNVLLENQKRRYSFNAFSP